MKIQGGLFILKTFHAKKTKNHEQGRNRVSKEAADQKSTASCISPVPARSRNANQNPGVDWAELAGNQSFAGNKNAGYHDVAKLWNSLGYRPCSSILDIRRRK